MYRTNHMLASHPVLEYYIFAKCNKWPTAFSLFNFFSFLAHSFWSQIKHTHISIATSHSSTQILTISSGFCCSFAKTLWHRYQYDYLFACTLSKIISHWFDSELMILIWQANIFSTENPFVYFLNNRFVGVQCVFVYFMALFRFVVRKILIYVRSFVLEICKCQKRVLNKQKKVMKTIGWNRR